MTADAANLHWHSVHNYQGSGCTRVVCLENIIDTTTNILAEKGSSQILTIYKWGYVNVPFAVVSPKFLKRETEQVMYTPLKDTTDELIFGLALLGLTIYAATQSFRNEIFVVK